jgi:four helix bundle protein
MAVDRRKKYDLEERTFEFAKNVRALAAKLPNTLWFIEDVKQLIRASGSVGANYIEANESLSKKDFLMRLKISRREAKECCYFLRLISENTDNLVEKEVRELYVEAREIRNILSAIILKCI